MAWYIRPDDIIAEIRKRYPTERVTEPPQRPIAPRIGLTNENLYGVMIYIYGEGVKGQYLRHGIYERNGARYWSIEYGWVTLYGRLRDGVMLPLVVMGLPTRFVYEYRPREFTRFVLEEIPMGVLETREDQILNLARVMEGRDPILLIDKYNLLRSGDGVPQDIVDRIVEQQKMIEDLQKTVFEYERIVNELRTNVSILEARLQKYRELVRTYESRLVRLYTEVTSIQDELLRLREEVIVRGAEAQALEEARRRLRAVIDSLMETLGSTFEAVAELQKRIQTQQPQQQGGGGEE